MFSQFKALFIVLSFCFYCNYAHGESETVKKVKVLVGSPVRQKPAILRNFLDSLKRSEEKTYSLDFLFVDDNDIEESHKILQNFAQEQGLKCSIYFAPTSSANIKYICDETTHHWNDAIIHKVTAFKDKIIEFAKDKEYDYLLLIDSDTLLHPKTIDQLIQDNKDIVCNILWTSWSPNSIPQPNVWVANQYDQFEKEENEILTQQEITKRFYAFLAKLRNPGLYEIGGFGGCSLLSKAALKKGVCFKRIQNIDIWGEDRYFCIRAQALGFSLFVDTNYPAYHIFREKDLAGVEDFMKRCEPGSVQ